MSRSNSPNEKRNPLLETRDFYLGVHKKFIIDTFGSAKKKEPRPKKQTEPPLPIVKHMMITRSKGGVMGPKKAVNEERYKKPKLEERVNSFGHIDGILEGETFKTRLECSHAGIHRPTVAGIHGNSSDGCFSIVLNGNYEDDEDNGNTLTYTGSGGRDLRGTPAKLKNLRTAPQTKDQTLTGANYSLSLNVASGQPVRVVRGFKCGSKYAPEEGYRYDGLYRVLNYKKVVGKSGYKVIKFRLAKFENENKKRPH